MRNPTTRPGFTLVELMVAMALTLFVMVILSQAFVMAIETFSGMKGIGDMQQNLRTASVLLRDDLIEDHFEGKRRLSDVAMLPTGPTAAIVNQRPMQGFFAIGQYTPTITEGTDANAMPSYRATSNVLYMTVKRKGNRTENFFSNVLLGDAAVLSSFFAQPTAYNIPASPNMPSLTWASVYQAGATQGFYNSQWAEVLYYLVQTGTTEEPNIPTSTNGTPTFSLYRAQFGMVPDATSVNGKFVSGLEGTTFAQLSCNASAGGVEFYTPTDAAKIGAPKRMLPDLATFSVTGRFSPTASVAVPVPVPTLVLPNVISFHVQAKALISAAAPNFVDVSLYDTTKFGVAGYTNNGLKGVQITLRVWDPKTRQTRQITVVQDL